MQDVDAARMTALAIYEQLQTGAVIGCSSGMHAMACWGFNSPKIVKADEAICDARDGLLFKVSGRLLKGSVKVSYDEGTDTYVVHFMDSCGSQINELSGIHWYDLAQQIDFVVESGIKQ